MKISPTINGITKEVELTAEQEDLFRRSPFDVPTGSKYYYIDIDGAVESDICSGYKCDTDMIETANGFNSEQYAERVAKEQLLYRRLCKFAEENNKTKLDWKIFSQPKYFIRWDCDDSIFKIDSNYYYKTQGAVYFDTRETACTAYKSAKPLFDELYSIKAVQNG